MCCQVEHVHVLEFVASLCCVRISFVFCLSQRTLIDVQQWSITGIELQAIVVAEFYKALYQSSVLLCKNSLWVTTAWFFFSLETIHWDHTGQYRDVFPFVKKNTRVHRSHTYIGYVVCLDRPSCERKLNWCAELYTCKVVIVVHPGAVSHFSWKFYRNYLDSFIYFCVGWQVWLPNYCCCLFCLHKR